MWCLQLQPPCLPANMSWHLPAPTFGVLRWAPHSSSFSIPAPVCLMCLSLDPENSSSQDSQLPPRQGISDCPGYKGITHDDLWPTPASGQQVSCAGITIERFLQRMCLYTLPLLPIPEFYTPQGQKVLLVVSPTSCMLPLTSDEGRSASAQRP